MTAPVAVTIAGSDPGGGAGLQADLKVFTTLGIHGAVVVTSVTVQDTRRVDRVEPVDPALVTAQLDAVLADLPVAAMKTGLLPTAEIIAAVATRVGRESMLPLVVDPVLVATSGDALARSDAAAALRAHLLPLAALVTPNLAEASALTGREVQTVADMRVAARALRDLGARAVLVKGGHLAGAAVDLLLAGETETVLHGTRFEGGPWHGTGCALSAAIAAYLAAGATLLDAVVAARAYVADAIRRSHRLGRGARVLDHDPRSHERSRSGRKVLRTR